MSMQALSDLSLSLSLYIYIYVYVYIYIYVYIDIYIRCWLYLTSLRYLVGWQLYFDLKFKSL